jgi:phosphoesterase RecJ-like protein
VWAAVLATVRASRRILLPLHVRPDGDSVGSSLAVARGLRALGKTASVVSADPLPSNLRFLDPGSECLQPAAIAGDGWDLALLLDCADEGRLGAAAPLLQGVPRTVNIDHHASNSRYAGLNVVDERCAACAELALRLLDDLGCALDPGMATALFAALATDTGSFRYAATSPATLAAAARLRAAGADLDRIQSEIWEHRSLPSLRVLAIALQSLTVDAGGELAWVAVSDADLAAAGADAEATEGLVDYPRTLHGVEVAALFVHEGSGGTRISLRSRTRVDVSVLAARFGGGGHPRAAGCTVTGPPAEARDRVLAAAREALARPGGAGGQAAGDGRP